MNLSDGQFKDLHKRLKRDGGFSINVNTGEEPKVGYMVSLPGYEMQVRSQNVSPAHIKEYVERHAAELAGDERYLGGWNNKKASPRMSSFDVSNNITPNPAVAKEYGNDVALADARTSALDLSYARNQEAAYDLQTEGDLPNPQFDSSRRKNAD